MKHKTQVLLSLTLLTLLLAACQAGEEEAATPTAVAAATATSPPTATAPPPTATPAPTATPSPEPSPTAPPPTPTEAAPRRLDYLLAHGGNAARDWDQANLEAFMAEHPDVDVRRSIVNLYGNPVPGLYYLFKDDPSRNYDVVSTFIVGQNRERVAAGEIADISDLWAANGWDDVFPASVKELVTFDGKQYFVPQAMQWNPMWYRTDIFADNGLTPPETWDELLAACDTLHAAGVIPITVATRSWVAPVARWFTYINLRLNGLDFHEALMQGAVPYDDPGVVAVFEHWAELFEHNCFREEFTSYGLAAQHLADGDAAMYLLGEWLSESYSDGLPATLDFFSFPIINPDVPRSEVLHLYGAYLPANAANPDDARAFLTYLGSAASQQSNVEALGRLPSRSDVDISGLTAVYSRGYDFVREAEGLTQLFEFNTDQIVAGEAMRDFVNFWRDRETAGDTITALERARAQAYPE